jgi:hypothetical protein
MDLSQCLLSHLFFEVRVDIPANNDHPITDFDCPMMTDQVRTVSQCCIDTVKKSCPAIGNEQLSTFSIEFAWRHRRILWNDSQDVDQDTASEDRPMPMKA